MEKHVTILGAIYIVFSALGILAAMALFIILSGAGLIAGDEDAMLITTIIGSIIAFFLIVVSAPGIIGGIGLLKRSSWARILVLILGILNLLNIPIGTVLGIYTLWVLLHEETVNLFKSSSDKVVSPR